MSPVIGCMNIPSHSIVPAHLRPLFFSPIKNRSEIDFFMRALWCTNPTSPTPRESTDIVVASHGVDFNLSSRFLEIQFCPSAP